MLAIKLRQLDGSIIPAIVNNISRNSGIFHIHIRSGLCRQKADFFSGDTTGELESFSECGCWVSGCGVRCV